MQITDDMPKYEQAYFTLIKRLKSDRYPVGSRMPTEGDLANQFEMSRVTIRHALDMLVKDGYVESRRGSGYTVLTLSPASDTCLISFTDAMLTETVFVAATPLSSTTRNIKVSVP